MFSLSDFLDDAPEGVSGDDAPDRAPPALPAPSAPSDDGAGKSPNFLSMLSSGGKSGDSSSLVPGMSNNDAVMLATQLGGRMGQASSQLGAQLADAGALMRGEKSNFDQIAARGEANSQQGVKDLLARREASRQALQDKQAAALQDPDSDVSRLSTQLATSRKLIAPGQKITGAQWGIIKDAGSWDEAQKRLDAETTRAATAQKAENDRMAAEIASREKEGAAGRGNQVQLERERMAQERAMHLEDINAKKGEAGKLKPLPAEVNQKIAGTTAGASALNDVWDKFNSVGKAAGIASAIPLVPTSTNAREYKDLTGNKASPIAVAELPNARETPGLVEHFGDKLPAAADSKERAAQNILSHFQNMETKLQGEIIANKGQYDTSGIERELAGVQAQKARFIQGAKDHLGAAATERRKLPDGRILEKGPDGSVSVVQ